MKTKIFYSILFLEAASLSPPASASSPSAPSWQEQLLPLVVTLRDCVREAVRKALPAVTYVILRGVAAATVSQGPVQIVQRRHAVFSQAVRQKHS